MMRHSKSGGGGGVRNKQIRRRKARRDTHLNEMLQMCLAKVCELQHELNKADESEEDAQAAGYAACATEALAFLAREGLSQDHPMVRALTDKLAQVGAGDDDEEGVHQRPAGSVNDNDHQQPEDEVQADMDN